MPALTLQPLLALEREDMQADNDKLTAKAKNTKYPKRFICDYFKSDS
ncbi:MAG: hypothetical protein RL335_111 [Bacteroidota bacterium]|jgi:hypothetical protein